MRSLILVMAMALAGCSTVQKLALKGVTPIFVDGSDKLTLERNWEFFRYSAPANLKLIEMLYLQDPKNLDLLATLVKSYAGYAYAIPETLAFGDALAGIDDSIHKKNAITFYTRSLDYGLDYLQLKGIKRSALLGLDEKAMLKLIDEKLDKKDLSTVLFLAQSWLSLINLQKDNVALISHVPKAKVLFDWVCGKKPSIENGICDIFYAQYEASRPRMLGGNPEKARELYQAAINKRPRHLLMRVGLIQYLILPGFEKEAYNAQAKILQEEFAKWEDLNRDTLDDNSDYKAVEHLNLFNAIAKKRFEFLEKNKTKIFEGSDV